MGSSPATDNASAWKVLIADDDEEVHAAIRYALRGVIFQGKSLEFIDAYSGADTLIKLQDNPDTAVILLDVIMEQDNAGLAAVKTIRENGFNAVRIIIHTGLPGSAHERQVIVDYDIHDYKEKAATTTQSLFTSLISALRAYNDLAALENHRRGLLSVLYSVSWFDFDEVHRYVSGMLAVFSGLTHLSAERVVMVWRSSKQATHEPVVLASLGDWQSDIDPVPWRSLSQPDKDLIVQTFNTMQEQNNIAGKTLFMRRFGIDLVALVAGGDNLMSNVDEVLLDVFLGTVCQCINSQHSFAGVSADRDALFIALAAKLRNDSQTSRAKIDQMSQIATAIARQLNARRYFPNDIDDQFVRDIGIAATFVDYDNARLPPATHSGISAIAPEAYQPIRLQIAAGLNWLAQFPAPLQDTGTLVLAHDIVSACHAYFDGSGYPPELCGEDIPVAARIVSVAMTYLDLNRAGDLLPARPAISVIQEAAGTRFDPRIVDTMLDILPHQNPNEY